jgi:quinol monooxygenase YgiN
MLVSTSGVPIAASLKTQKMITIDPTNQLSVGLDLYAVAPHHQSALVVSLIQEQLPVWAATPAFVSASVHESLDQVSVFVYTQWKPLFDYRTIPRPLVLSEYSAPDSQLLQVFASRSKSQAITIQQGKTITHLAEFKMMPIHQGEMVVRATSAVGEAINEVGLHSATFHRSIGGTRLYNYGQWESEEAFKTFLKKPSFNPNQKPYWDGLARNEFHLYRVVHTQS